MKKLQENELIGAAQEFKSWNKATVNGERVELLGLTNRRKDERELF